MKTIVMSLAVGLFMMMTVSVWAQTDSASDVVRITSTTHFVGPDGNEIGIEPGDYTVEQAEEWIRLVPQGRNRNEAILLAAETLSHSDSLDESKAVIVEFGNGDSHLFLFLPTGIGFLAQGTATGIRTRGLTHGALNQSSRKAFSAVGKQVVKKLPVIKKSGGTTKGPPDIDYSGIFTPTDPTDKFLFQAIQALQKKIDTLNNHVHRYVDERPYRGNKWVTWGQIRHASPDGHPGMDGWGVWFRPRDRQVVAEQGTGKPVDKVESKARMVEQFPGGE